MDNNKGNLRLFFALTLFATLTNAPAFSEGNKEYLISDFGAIGDGKTLNTQAIQKAINTANVNGGGKVIVPEGIYLTGSVVFKSDVELHLQENAVLLGSTHPKNYQSLAMDGRPESPKKDDNSQLA